MNFAISRAFNASTSSWMIPMRLLAIALVLFVFDLALADTWIPPKPVTYASLEGRFRLTIFPALQGTRRFFAGETGGLSSCEATLEKLVGDSYEQVWRKPLVNKIAPASALVSDLDGSFVTFDNWYSRGWGTNAIVIYSAAGELRRTFSLTDILSKQEFDELPRSVSSINWGGEHYLDSSEPPVVHLTVVLREAHRRNRIEREYKTVLIQLDTAEVLGQ